MSAPPPPPLPNRESWWDRNWKWVATLLTLAAALIGVAFVGLAQGILKGSEPFQIAVKRARESPEVVAALGTPIQEGWLAMGQMQELGPVGQADLSGRLKGPKAEADLFINGSASGGVWKLTIIVQVDKSGQRIDLSDAGVKRDRLK